MAVLLVPSFQTSALRLGELCYFKPSSPIIALCWNTPGSTIEVVGEELASESPGRELQGLNRVHGYSLGL